ncbi:hypothetical protein AGABI2DRAFT_181776 [Agaricus bisporus var. bisporus H97]|uniref:hypothetical protein n=1 Tax=Agaricus bisporus var. bisporus (strain H97 / ATCC MYA-4626 / FGSC 10389) TaxID=936046 RepID=UPI00029F6B14|nr:hypothetical protein AGABI2DRAFT_181776 [Agaricus bisporus var. bisporus H97]EKV41638.1 hypothetical protein AGABI2DRAFT_181776 [Agaricus bisporus var. bisporus H97]
MPVFRFRRPSHSKSKPGTPRTAKESNIIVHDGVDWLPAKVRCENCGPEECYDAVTSRSLRRCLGCRKRHLGCVRDSDTVATKAKRPKVLSKIPGIKKSNPKAPRRVLRMEAVVITSLPPGRKKVQAQQQKARGPEPEEEPEARLEMSSVKQDLEAMFKQSEMNIRAMKEQIAEAEKLQTMNVEILNRFGSMQVWPTPNSASSSTSCSSSVMKVNMSREENKSRLAATGSMADGLPDLLLTLREVIDETLARKVQRATRKRMTGKDEEIIDLT